MEWLWDVAVGPILDALGFGQAPSPATHTWPHVWWIPTRELTYLPLHAAGRHFEASKDSALNRVISSYCSSVKVLIYGGQHSLRKPTEDTSDNAVLPTMEETPALENSVLRFAAEEAKMLEQLCPSLRINPIKPRKRRYEVIA